MRQTIAVIVLMVAFMSGILSIAREALSIFSPGKIPQGILFWRCMWLAFIFSAAATWYLEHGKVREMEMRIQRMEADVPDLRGWIDGVVTGEQRRDSGDLVPVAVLIVSIKNLKAPSIAQGYACTARRPNGESFEGQPQTVPADMKLQGDWGIKDFANTAPLYDKTAETPIERGGMRRGVLVFIFPGAKSRFGVGSTFEITFEDVLGKKASVMMSVKGSDKLESPLYYPGMQKP